MPRRLKIRKSAHKITVNNGSRRNAGVALKEKTR